MDELTRGTKLRRCLVEAWNYFDDDDPAFNAAESERLNSRQTWKDASDKLHEKLVKYLITGTPDLTTLQNGHPKLMLLSALDSMLFDHFGDLVGNQPPPVPVKIGNHTWQLMSRFRPLGVTIHQQQRGHLNSYLRCHHILPTNHKGRSIVIRHVGGCLKTALAAWKKPHIKIYLGNFADRVFPDWNGKPDNLCVTQRLTDTPFDRDHTPDEQTTASERGTRKRHESVIQRLEHARKEHVNIVVFPELTISLELRQMIAEWLAGNSHPFLMVVPGSFHEPIEADRSVNRTVLLDGKGQEVLVHDKIIPFGTDKIGHEQIRTGETIKILMTPIGSLILAICRDFLEEGSSQLPWQQLAPDWAIIPSMTEASGVRAHLRHAQLMGRCCQTRSIVANQSLDGTDKDHGFTCFLEQNRLTDSKAKILSISLPNGPNIV